MKLLLVEDEAAPRLTLMEALRQGGYVLEVAATFATRCGGRWPGCGCTGCWCCWPSWLATAAWVSTLYLATSRYLAELRQLARRLWQWLG